MKHYIYIILSLLSIGLLSSCSDNDYSELDKGSDVLTIRASQAVTKLDEVNHSSEAVTLDWTTGNNSGSGNKIYYTLELAKAGTDFADPYVAIDHQAQVYEWSVNQENLNNLVLDKFGGVIGSSTTIDARIIASIPDISDIQTSSVSFPAIPYQAVTSTLYLIGDATPNGWSADNPTALTRSDNGKFTWSGKLKSGHFKFITTLGKFLPSYNRSANGGVFLRSSDAAPDDQWTITEAHAYKVAVDLLDSTIELTQIEETAPAFDNLYFVGNPTGWNFVKMTKDPLDSYLFRYGRYFESGKGGEFKFGTAEGSWENMYKAVQDNAPYTDTKMSLVTGFDPDHKWNLQDSECGKAYKICVDIRTGKERMMMSEFKPYDMVYLVGDACEAGWTIGNALPMTSTDSKYILTWTGKLNAGELKFTCDKKSDLGGAWFMNYYGSDKEPTGKTEPMLFIDKSNSQFKAQYLETAVGDVDQKWKITSSGTYTITLNQLDETISIVKQ